jgi:dolichyl-phosphate beta-glucosyltransferase
VPAPFLSIIIPAYNEEQRLPGTLQSVHSFLSAQSYAWELIVVENGSRDRTYDVAAEFAAAHANTRVLRAAGRGKGLAVRMGMLDAKGEHRMMLDADLSMPIDQVPRFLPPKLNADIVIASREAPGAVRYDEPSYRHIGGRVINTMIRLLALPGLHDTQCGFKCFSARSAQDLFSEQTIEGWAFDIEILYVARLRGYSVVELPIPWHYSPQSHLRPVQDALRMFFDLLHIRLNHLRGAYAR